MEKVYMVMNENTNFGPSLCLSPAGPGMVMC